MSRGKCVQSKVQRGAGLDVERDARGNSSLNSQITPRTQTSKYRRNVYLDRVSNQKAGIRHNWHHNQWIWTLIVPDEGSV